MSEDLNKRHKAALDVALMDLDVAAIPTKSDVFVRCGTGARDLHDAITDLRQRLQAAEERAEKMREDLALTAALARELFKRDRLIVEGDKLVFTGPWARVGSVSVSDILDRADAALKTEGA